MVKRIHPDQLAIVWLKHKTRWNIPQGSKRMSKILTSIAKNEVSHRQLQSNNEPVLIYKTRCQDLVIIHQANKKLCQLKSIMVTNFLKPNAKLTLMLLASRKLRNQGQLITGRKECLIISKQQITQNALAPKEVTQTVVMVGPQMFQLKLQTSTRYLTQKLNSTSKRSTKSCQARQKWASTQQFPSLNQFCRNITA